MSGTFQKLTPILVFWALNLFHCPASANSVSCYSFIPYGYLEFYNKLIEDSEDCYFYFKSAVHFKTGSDGERIIGPENAPKMILGLGESQLMGIDWTDDDGSRPHDLNILFPNAKLLLYAAPNNGPIQNLSRLKDIPAEKLRKADEIVVSFNFSTDIFRIINNWDHKNSSPISYSYFKAPFFKYILFDALLLSARLSDKKFGSSVPNKGLILEEYRHIDQNYLLNSYLEIMKKLIQSIRDKNKNITLIIYPPYWGIDDEGKLFPDIASDYLRFICSARNSLGSMSRVIYANNNHVSTSEDGRHFPQGSLTYAPPSQCPIN